MIHNHAPLQIPGHLYMHKRDTCSVFCRNYEMDFYTPLENYFTVKEELLVTLGTLNKTCIKLRQTEECQQKLNNLWVDADDLERITRIIQTYYTNSQCVHRVRRSQKPLILYYLMPNDHENNLMELKSLLGKILKAIKFINDQKSEMYFDGETIELFHMLEQVAQILQKNAIINQYMIDILCNRSYNALLKLITIDSMKEKITSINKQASSDACRVPEIIDIIDLIRLLEISEMQTMMVADIFTVNLKIPSIHNIKYSLYQVISLPFTYKNRSYGIRPMFPYYLVSENAIAGTTLIYTMRFEDMKECINSTFGRICRPNTPSRPTFFLQYSKRTRRLQNIQNNHMKTREKPFGLWS